MNTVNKSNTVQYCIDITHKEMRVQLPMKPDITHSPLQQCQPNQLRCTLQNKIISNIGHHFGS